MRICSLLPSSTEIVYALGMGDSLVGVTFECDYPPEAREKRVIVHSRLTTGADAATIDREVRELVAEGGTPYRIDLDALRELAPDVVLTQDLCNVCAVTPGDVAQAIESLDRRPDVVSLHPHSLADVWEDVRSVGRSIGRVEVAEELVAARLIELEAIRTAVADVSPRPRVACLEWLEPPFSGGHWVPEMVAMAGGIDVLAKPGERSRTLSPGEIGEAAPDIVVFMPCGYDLEKAFTELSEAELPSLAEVCDIHIVDASSYFSRPGPRLVTGISILARLFHPERWTPELPEKSWRRFN